MPEYALRCRCGERFDVACPFSRRDEQPCPACSATAAPVDWERQNIRTEREFSSGEQLSFTEGCHPREVPILRKHITAGTIHDNGRVSFKNRQEQRQYVKQHERMMQSLSPRV